MSGLSSAQTYAARLTSAIKESNWDELEHSLERLKQIFFESVVFGHRDTATFIGKSIADARVDLVLKERVSQERSAETMSWALASDSATCLIGLRMFRSDASPHEAPPETAQQQILMQLFESATPLNTGEIAKRIGCAPETTSRALTVLRDKNLVRTVPVGRARLHYITRRGQLHLMGTQGGHIRPAEPALSKPETPKKAIIKMRFDEKTLRFERPSADVPREWVENVHDQHVSAEAGYANNPDAVLCLYSSAEKNPAAEANPGGVR